VLGGNGSVVTLALLPPAQYSYNSFAISVLGDGVAIVRQRYQKPLLRYSLLVLILVAAYLFVFVGRRTTIPNTPYVLVIQPGVSDKSVQLVIVGLELSDQYLVAMTGRTVSAPTEVRIANFTPCSPLKPIPQLAATAQVLGNRLCVNTHSGVWRQALQDNPGIALAVIAHEHYHVWQQQLGCLSPPWNKEYDWLIEGGASYVGWETAITSGHLSRSWVDNLLQNMRRSDPQLGTLASYEGGVAGDASYSLAYQAVQQLIQKSGSLSSSNDFCERVGQGESWHRAFERTFGMTPEAFYSTFETAR
jgi:hypothetical protein